MVKSINFVVLGKQDIASEFGKKGTESDLTLYDRKESDIIKTWVIPNGFPEKIQPLFQAINLAEYVIFHVDKLDKFTGEQIIALDSLKKEKGILSHTFDVDESKLNMMIKGTVVENYTRVEQDKIKEEMNALEPITNDNPAELLIDHCFDVKGVGTVITNTSALTGSVNAFKFPLFTASSTKISRPGSTIWINPWLTLSTTFLLTSIPITVTPFEASIAEVGSPM